MNPAQKPTSTLLRRSRRVAPILLAAALWCGVMVVVTASALPAGAAVEHNTPLLEFVEPTNNAVFSTLEEIPIVLRASAPDDVVLAAEVLANGDSIGQAIYCCLFCPCARPVEGQETTLRIPVPWEGGMPPPRTWQGWTNVQAGTYSLVARAVSDKGVPLESAPVTVMVLDLTLQIYLGSDGAVTLVIPQGSLVPGGYDLEASDDLRVWTRLGPFQPGDVASFYFDPPPPPVRARRFYRSVRVPPQG